MTTTTNAGISPETAGEIPPAYPQTKLRIVATYLATSGEAPESVEIEINDGLPDDVLTFIDGLIMSLFRHSPASGSVQITNNTRSGVTR